MASVEASGVRLTAAWGLIALTFCLVVALLWQALDVYLVFDGSSITPSAAQGTRYVWTASLCVASAVAAVCVSMWVGNRAAVVTGLIGLVLALAAAALFAVPQDRWHGDPAPQPLPSDYEPCYSGSNECN